MTPCSPASIDAAPTPRAARRGRESGAAKALLSLVFLLLGFFAMLNALSERDSERARMVLNSVAAVFGPLEVFGAQPGPPAVAGELIARERDRLGDVLEAFLADARIEPVRVDELVRYAVPASRLFVAESESPLPGAPTALAALAEAVGRPPPGLVFLVEIVAMGPLGDPTGLGGRRAVRLARALVDLGLDPALVTAGVATGRSGTIDLAIRWASAEARETTP